MLELLLSGYGLNVTLIFVSYHLVLVFLTFKVFTIFCFCVPIEKRLVLNFSLISIFGKQDSSVIFLSLRVIF